MRPRVIERITAWLGRWSLAALGFVALFGGLPGSAASAAEREVATRSVTPRGALAADEKAMISLFERARDSVVYISTASLVRDAWTRNIFAVPRGTGSGFVWDDGGHVVTNYHVIEGAAEATVKLADGRDYRGVLVGASPAHDIAVLRIGVASKRPPPVPIGTSADLKVGQRVFAIGNPFGLDWTMTTGIISALDRSLSGDKGGPTIEHLIQTDAAINPGNSGGPLLDSAGRLIGINTAIYSPSGASVGIGFAVPVDTVMRVVPQLIRNGRYVRPVLGVDADEDLNEQITNWLGFKGVVLLRVTPGSAADKAGLKAATLARDGGIVPGDVITAVQGKPVGSVRRLLSILDDHRVGDKLRLTVRRGERTREVEVVLQAGS